MNENKFAAFISYLTKYTGCTFDSYECDEVARQIKVLDVPNIKSAALVDELLRTMAEGKEKIPPIKAYRELTGVGLKEAKDAIERYYVEKPCR